MAPGFLACPNGCTTCCDREQVWSGAWETEVSVQSLMHFMEETQIAQWRDSWQLDNQVSERDPG